MKVGFWSIVDRFLRVGRRGIIFPLIVSVACWSCAPVNTERQSDLVIGVVDPQRILLETTQGKRLSDTLTAFMKDRQLLVELEQKELRDLEEELRAQRTVLSQSAREFKEEQFRQKMGVYQQKVADLNLEVQEKQRELQNEFRRQVGVVVSQVGKKRNLALVMEHGPSSGTLYFQESLDISTEVIQALNQKSESAGLP